MRATVDAIFTQILFSYQIDDKQTGVERNRSTMQPEHSHAWDSLVFTDLLFLPFG